MDTLSTQKPLEVYKPQFHGKAAEFFKIWIVNVVLSILTVGIYSAWAKVRTRKYIYGNLELAGSRFDYHADPIKILKGRLIVGGIFLIYYFGGLLSPTLSAVAGLAFLMIFPWIIVKALMFNLYNTSYRNIRFGFVDDVKGCYTTGIKAALITVVTIGLAVPYAHYLFARFKVSNMKYGKEKFSFGAHAKSFFGIYYSAFGMALLLYLACLLLVLAFAAISSSLTD
ncbi:MAG: YjgN family protein, partial [Pseudobdellovibrionaceae bacterium]